MRYLTLILLIISTLQTKAQEVSYICAGNTTAVITCNCTGGTAPYSYSWVAPSGAGASTASINVNGRAGTFTWTCTDVNGCVKTGTHTVNVETAPTIAVTAVNSCVGTNQTVAATGVPGGYTYSWNFGAGASPATSTSASTSVVWSSGGSKNITLTISRTLNGSANGCNATCTWNANKNITIGDISGSSSCSN